jgi:SynChlorMet cassette protein ScmD
MSRASRQAGPPRGNPVANPAVLFREAFDGWAILLNPDTGEAAAINPIGVSVWKLMDGSHSSEAIIASLRSRFAGVPDSAIEDVFGYILDLARLDFVIYEDSGSDSGLALG